MEGVKLTNSIYFKRFITIFIVFLIVIFTSKNVLANNNGRVKETVETVGGDLVIKMTDYMEEDELSLDGKVIISSDEIAGMLHINSKFHVDGNDVILITTGCSGSACSFLLGDIYIISPDGNISKAIYKSESDSLHTDDDFKVSQDGNKLLIIGKEIDGRRVKTLNWVYENKQIEKIK